jgi:hypothetical protein
MRPAAAAGWPLYKLRQNRTDLPTAPGPAKRRQTPSLLLAGRAKPGCTAAVGVTRQLRHQCNIPIPSPAKPRHQFLGYLAQGSFLSNTCGPEADGVEPVVPTPAERALPVGESALALPATPLLDAFVDAYFVNLFPLLPVVDRSDVSGDDRSILLLQCLSLLGSHFRYRRPPSIPSPGSLYAKVKSLLDQNYERDPLTTLKALCLIACRSAESPTVVSLDSPWHWLGVDTRYALSMGLHREATYQGRPSAGISRRIWWHLFVRAGRFQSTTC